MSDSNKNEHQEYFLGNKGGQCVGLTTFPPSHADYQTPVALTLFPGRYRNCFTFIYIYINGLTYFIVFSEKLKDSGDGNELWAPAE